MRTPAEQLSSYICAESMKCRDCIDACTNENPMLGYYTGRLSTLQELNVKILTFETQYLKSQTR